MIGRNDPRAYLESLNNCFFIDTGNIQAPSKGFRDVGEAGLSNPVETASSLQINLQDLTLK